MKKENSTSTRNNDLSTSKYVYHDYSTVPCELVQYKKLKIKTSPSAIRLQKLPTKLSSILSNPEFSNIVTWMPHGRAWRILKPKLFISEVIPIYFEHSNYNSFIKLVNSWGFRRMASGIDRGSYYHELFLRDMPHLHNRMRRLTPIDKKKAVDPGKEPDFYDMNTNFALPLPLLLTKPSKGNETIVNDQQSRVQSVMPSTVGPYLTEIDRSLVTRLEYPLMNTDVAKELTSLNNINNALAKVNSYLQRYLTLQQIQNQYSLVPYKQRQPLLFNQNVHRPVSPSGSPQNNSACFSQVCVSNVKPANLRRIFDLKKRNNRFMNLNSEF